MSWSKYQGKFVVLEGIDGSGKGTFINRMVEDLKNLDIEYKIVAISNIVREYTGQEEYSKELKEKILKVEEMLSNIDNEIRKNMLVYYYNGLFLAYLDLGRLVSKEIIQPLLDKNVLVIGDRWFLSTLAYNAGIKKTFMSRLLRYSNNEGTKREDVPFFIDPMFNKHNKDHQLQAKYIRECCKDILIPDLTIYLDVKAEAAISRINNSGRKIKETFEKEAILDRVRNAYEYICKSYFKDSDKIAVNFTKKLASRYTYLMDEYTVYKKVLESDINK